MVDLSTNSDQAPLLDNLDWFYGLLLLGAGSGLALLLLSLRFKLKRTYLTSIKESQRSMRDDTASKIELVSTKYPNASLSAPPPHWYLEKGTSHHDSRQPSCKHLSAAYQSLYASISQVSASCAQLAVDDVLQRLSIEAPTRVEDFEIATHIHQSQLMDVLDALNIKSMSTKEGLMLHDMSGVGLYAMALYLANAWAQGKTLNKYDAVLIVPIEQLVKKVDRGPSSLVDFFNLWDLGIGEAVVDQIKHPLIIFSGCSEHLKLYGRDKGATQELIRAWLDFADDYERIYITDAIIMPDYLRSQVISHALSISLRPMHFKYVHCPAQPHLTAGGVIAVNALEEAAKVVIEQALYYDSSTNTICIRKDKTDPIEREFLSVRHTLPVFETAQTFIRYLLSISNNPSEWISPAYQLDTISKWYAASVTATQTEGYMSYYVNDALMIRKSGSQYVAHIGDFRHALCQYLQAKTLDDMKTAKEWVVFEAILKSLVARPGFDEWDINQLIREVEAVKRALERQGVIERLDKKALKRYKKLVGLLSAAGMQKMLESLFNTNKSQCAYSSIQDGVNEEIKAIPNIVKEIRHILSNSKQSNAESLKLGIAAIMLAETHRTQRVRGAPSFLMTLCLLDLIEISNNANKMMQQFFAHPALVDMDSNSFESAICMDVISMLGGLHPMSQGNSYRQTAAKKKPYYGSDWVEFKSQIILMQWLEVSLKNDKALNPHLEGHIELRKNIQSDTIPDIHIDYGDPELNKKALWIYHRLAKRVESLEFGLQKTPSFKQEILSSNNVICPKIKTNPRSIRIGVSYEAYQIFKKIYGDHALDQQTIQARSYLMPVYRYEKAIFYCATQHYRDAINELEVLLAIDPECQHLYLLLAQCHCELQEKWLAKKVLNSYFQMAPPNDKFRYLGNIIKTTIENLADKPTGLGGRAGLFADVTHQQESRDGIISYLLAQLNR